MFKLWCERGIRFWCVIITTLYQLMLQSWFQKTAQSLVNTVVLFSWHNKLPWQHYCLLKTPLISLIFQKRHGQIFSYYRILISRMRCNFWQSLNKFCTWGSEPPIVVTYCVTKTIPTCSPVIEPFFDTMIVASIDKEW